MVTTMKCEQTQYFQSKAPIKIARFFNVQNRSFKSATSWKQSATSWKQSATSWKYLTFRPPTNVGKYRPKKTGHFLISLISLIEVTGALKRPVPS